MCIFWSVSTAGQSKIRTHRDTGICVTSQVRVDRRRFELKKRLIRLYCRHDGSHFVKYCQASVKIRMFGRPRPSRYVFALIFLYFRRVETVRSQKFECMEESSLSVYNESDALGPRPRPIRLLTTVVYLGPLPDSALLQAYITHMSYSQAQRQAQHKQCNRSLWKQPALCSPVYSQLVTGL